MIVVIDEYTDESLSEKHEINTYGVYLIEGGTVTKINNGYYIDDGNIVLLDKNGDEIYPKLQKPVFALSDDDNFFIRGRLEEEWSKYNAIMAHTWVKKKFIKRDQDSLNDKDVVRVSESMYTMYVNEVGEKISELPSPPNEEEIIGSATSFLTQDRVHQWCIDEWAKHWGLI